MSNHSQHKHVSHKMTLSTTETKVPLLISPNQKHLQIGTRAQKCSKTVQEFNSLLK